MRRSGLKASLWCLQLIDKVGGGCGVLHIFGARVEQIARDAGRLAVLLELDSEIGSVRRVLLVLAERWWHGVIEVDRRVIGTDLLIRRILRDPRQDGVAFREEFVELRHSLRLVAGEAKRMAAIAAVGRPVFHLLRIE